jgi:predicted histidine transporter YuiF (NhaC family)
MKNRTQVVIAIGVIVALYLWYGRERYENEKKEEVKDVAKEKAMSQAELDAVLKFIR